MALKPQRCFSLSVILTGSGQPGQSTAIYFKPSGKRKVGLSENSLSHGCSSLEMAGFSDAEETRQLHIFKLAVFHSIPVSL